MADAACEAGLNLPAAPALACCTKRRHRRAPTATHVPIIGLPHFPRCIMRTAPAP
ncbi:hypothetical protein BLAT2472_30702 [Burkholderia latens]